MFFRHIIYQTNDIFDKVYNIFARRIIDISVETVFMLRMIAGSTLRFITSNF